ncbi:MAG: hypothetical protein H7X94_08310 [Vallitaleaceae bacterium]|nr:hypothetical protein [Vallitaleaceae bacterium]
MKSTKALLDTIEKSINQKIELFEQLQALTLKQAQLLEVEEIDLTSFEELLDSKDSHIQQLDQIDEALSSILETNQHLLSSGLEAHNDLINQIKILLEQLTTLGQEIGKIEGTNKERLDQYFNNTKEDIRSFKKSKQAASKYNQNMSNSHQSDMSYFMDRKK